MAKADAKEVQNSADAPVRRSAPACEGCSQIQAPDVSGATLPERTRHLADVVEHEVVMNATKMHMVDVTGIVLMYTLTTPLTCSFPGNHTPHFNGAIARARCGAMLRIGHDCADKHVIGWDAVKKTLSELARRNRILAHIGEARGTFESTKARARAIPTRFKAELVSDIGLRLARLDELEQKILATETTERITNSMARVVASLSDELRAQKQELLKIIHQAENAMVLVSLQDERERKERELDPEVRRLFDEASKLP